VYQTDAEASVLTAIRDMFLGQPDGGSLVHRLAIFDAHGDINCIVSQMDVLRCVCIRNLVHCFDAKQHGYTVCGEWVCGWVSVMGGVCTDGWSGHACRSAGRRCTPRCKHTTGDRPACLSGTSIISPCVHCEHLEKDYPHVSLRVIPVQTAAGAPARVG
jgi:hypothetical protein